MSNVRYRRYLNSEKWEEKRNQVLLRAKYRCERCGIEGDLDVHHKTYERLGDEDLGDLKAVCRNCHEIEDKLRKDERDKRLDFENDEYYFMEGNEHIRSFHKIKFPEEMSDKEIGRLATLARELQNDNVLGYVGGGGIIAYNEKGIGLTIGLSQANTCRFIRKMMRLGIMNKAECLVNGKKYPEFYINPIYYIKGNRISRRLYLIFQEQLDKVIPDWAKQRYREREKEENSKKEG